jgi:hypothetical protein
VLSAIGARVVDEELPVAHAQEQLAPGVALDPELRDALVALLEQLVAAVEPARVPTAA